MLVVVWTCSWWRFRATSSTGIERIFLPLADIPPVGSWNIEVTPGVARHAGRGRQARHHRAGEVGARAVRANRPCRTSSGRTARARSSPRCNRASTPRCCRAAKPGDFAFSFSAVSQPFSFIVEADDSRSASVQVDVLPLPQLKGSVFQVTPPAYTGLEAVRAARAARGARSAGRLDGEGARRALARYAEGRLARRRHRRPMTRRDSAPSP